MKRLPTAVKKLRGTSQPCRENRAEPRAAPAKVPPPPRDLSDAERGAWVALAAALEAAEGVFTLADLPAFIAAVRVMGAADEVPANSDAGMKLRVQQRMWLTEFGLTPASRAKVHAAGGEQDDAAGEFLFGGFRVVEGGKGRAAKGE